MKFSEVKQYLKEGMKIRITRAFHCNNGVVNRACGCEGEGVLEDTTSFWIEPVTHMLNEYDEFQILTNPDGTPWVNPGWTCTCGSCKKPMPAVGRGACTCIPRRDDGTWDWGKAAKIEETEPKFKVGDKGRDPDCLRGITGITDFGGLYVSNGGYLKSITQLMREEGTINKPKMNVIKALKANLTPTDRKLVKHGYLTSKGERTDFYESELREAALSKLIEAEDTPEFRKELADALKCDDEE